MITHEATLVCDICHKSMLAGSVSQTERQARDSAIMAGKQAGWMVCKDGTAHCRTCTLSLAFNKRGTNNTFIGPQ